MTEQVHDVKQTGPVFHQVRGKTVPQSVHVHLAGIDSVPYEELPQCFPDGTIADSDRTVPWVVEQE